jgi:hypothetical protein
MFACLFLERGFKKFSIRGKGRFPGLLARGGDSPPTGRDNSHYLFCCGSSQATVMRCSAGLSLLFLLFTAPHAHGKCKDKRGEFSLAPRMVGNNQCVRLESWRASHGEDRSVCCDGGEYFYGEPGGTSRQAYIDRCSENKNPTEASHRCAAALYAFDCELRCSPDQEDFLPSGLANASSYEELYVCGRCADFTHEQCKGVYMPSSPDKAGSGDACRLYDDDKLEFARVVLGGVRTAPERGDGPTCVGGACPSGLLEEEIIFIAVFGGLALVAIVAGVFFWRRRASAAASPNINTAPSKSKGLRSLADSDCGFDPDRLASFMADNSDSDSGLDPAKLAKYLADSDSDSSPDSGKLAQYLADSRSGSGSASSSSSDSGMTPRVGNAPPDTAWGDDDAPPAYHSSSEGESESS